MFKKIRTFFQRTKWETVWSMDVKLTSKGEHVSSGIVTIKVGTNKPKYDCFFTNGITKTNVDIDYLIVKFPEVKDICKRYNIPT